MAIRAIWFAFLGLLVALPVASAGEVKAGPEHVARSVFTTGVSDREPVDALERLPATQERVYYFTELRDLQGQTITHRWLYGGQVMAEVAFSVGGPRWRVWSSKTLLPAWQGQWTVEVVDGEGTMLARESFTYGGQ